MLKKIILSLGATALVFTLSSCGSKQVPDEFMVLRNPPLVMPPDFNLAPKKGSPELTDKMTKPQEIAKKAVHGK